MVKGLEASTVQRLSASGHLVEDFREIDETEQGEILLRMEDGPRKRVLDELDVQDIVSFLEHLDVDEITDILQELEKSKREESLELFDPHLRERVNFLLRFHPESAAGVMNLNYHTIQPEESLEEVARQVYDYEKRRGEFPTLLVEDEDGFQGELPGAALARKDYDDKVSDHMADLAELPSVYYDEEDENVVDVFRENPNEKIIVLGQDSRILGVIYSDDLLRMIEEEASNTLYDFAVVEEDEDVWDSPLKKFKSRYRWLLINLGTAFLAAATVGLFEATISTYTLLAVYMPIVAGMGGNAGTQTMAVTVRGIALDQVSLKTGGRLMFNEVVASGANGLLNGVLVGLIASLFNQSPLLGAVIGVSMIINLMIAGLFGALIPLALERLDYDPATSATIFITTATDVLGFFIFLGIATMVL